MMRMAGFGTLKAMLRAVLAMLMLVLTALFCTFTANGFALCKHLMGNLAIAQQQAGREKTDIRTVAAKLNAMGYGCYIIIVKTCGGIHFAVLGAMQQFINELLVMVAAVVVFRLLWFVAFHEI